ncbi:MAG: PAS domain-containing sensor histidine kinase [Anaerolineae bacterium]|nr:PAS domain-containing sensor histidine kinase [Anaerolineae bacterium]
MKFNTALCFLLLAVCLYASIQKLSLYSRILALIVLAIAGLTLLQYLAALDLGIDQLLVTDTATAPANFPGRMSPGTAINFILLAIALLLFNNERLRRYAQIFSVAVTTISFFVLLGYFYRVEELYRLPLFQSMALHTTFTFLILSVGLMVLNPDNSFLKLLRDLGPAGKLTRWLFPSVIFIPALLGWIILLGEEAGFYSDTNRLALFVVCIVIMLLIITWLTGLSIQHTDQALRRTRTAYRILSNCNQSLIRAVDEKNLLEDLCQHIVSEGIYICAQVYYGNDNHDLQVVMEKQAPEYKNLDFREMFRYLATVTGWTPRVVVVSAPEPVKAAVLPMLNGLLVVYSPFEFSLDDQEMNLLTELAGDMDFGLRTLRDQQIRQQAEDQLIFQANLLENVFDAVVATDAGQRIRYWNQAAEKMYGWSADEVTGLTLREHIPTEYLSLTRSDVLEKVKQSGYWRGEIKQQRSDGRWLQVMTSITQIRDLNDQVTGLVAINRDVTEIRAAERRQRDIERRFQTVFENALDVIIIANGSDGKIIAVNNAVKRMLGYEPDELTGQDFATLFPSDDDTNSLLESLEAYREVTTAQKFLCKDGSIRIADFSANLIPWEDNHAILVFLRDITERLEMERQLIEAELNQIQMEKERELIRQREQVIATVSHEFRTPLTVIHSSTQILERYPHRLDEVRRQELYSQIHTQIDYMLGLIQDMLDFTHIRTKTYRPQLEAVNLKDFCKKLFDQMQLTSQSEADFVFEAGSLFELVTIDKALLNHILINLIGNAIKYSPQGGEIRFGLQRDDDHAVFEISDQGIGIPEEDQENLFKPFFRGGNVEGIGGTGLGMAIVYESVQTWGGVLNFESKLGQGSTFRVRLPLNSMITPDLVNDGS